MVYAEAKVYFDGSHYIAIPHSTRPSKKKTVKKEELIVVEKEIEEEPIFEEEVSENKEEKVKEVKEVDLGEPIKKTVKTLVSRSALFEKLYQESMDLPRQVRKQYIIDGMRDCFEDEEYLISYVEQNWLRKMINLTVRRVRMCRKINLQDFNYFCTFTYDSSFIDEETFRKKLGVTFNNFSTKKGWKYVGVWERSPENKRLHFHGLFYIPDGTLPGVLEEIRDYSFKHHNMQVIHQNTYFNDRFGRNDFELIEDNSRLGNAIVYLMKYIEKSGEKIVYSRGLPQFFISDIMGDDVVCKYGQEDKKLLLFDDFACYDEGEYIGKVSPKVIGQLRKVN